MNYVFYLVNKKFSVNKKNTTFLFLKKDQTYLNRIKIFNIV